MLRNDRSLQPAPYGFGAAGATRQTQPKYHDPYARNGLGVVPRRGWDSATRQFLSGDLQADSALLTSFSATFPLRLLALIRDVNPLVSLAWSNNLNLAFGPGDTRIVALKPGAGGDAGREMVDDEGTALLEDLWERHGGLSSLQRIGGDQAMIFGLLCFEAVPGRRGEGVADLFSFDPLSVRFRQGDTRREPPLVMQQYQQSDWKDLPFWTVFHAALDGTRDNPYGRPMFTSVATEALDDASIQRAMRDVLHSVAWPRLSVGFPLEELITFAQENHVALGLLPPGEVPAGEADERLTPTQWAMAQFNALKSLMETIRAGEAFIFPKGAEVGILAAGGALDGLADVLAQRRHRLVMATGNPPTLLGIVQGGTKAYSATDFKVYAQGLEALRGLVNALLVRVGNLHLRLLGRDQVARADVKPIRTEDLLAEARAQGLRIENERKLIAMGFRTPEESSVILTGSGVADREKAARIEELPASALPPGQGEDTEERETEREREQSQRPKPSETKLLLPGSWWRPQNW